MSGCMANGLSAEERFADLMRKRGYLVTPATEYENMVEHWDFRLTKGEECFRVDVKARKKINREDDDVQDERMWVEFLNVNGDNGWLFGKADYIAFETEHNWVVIERKKLVLLALKILIPNDRIKTRPGRGDLIALIKTSNIIEYGGFIV